MKEILSFLKKENADILFLQEVYSGTDRKLPDRLRSIAVLQNELNYPHIDFAPTYFEVHDSIKIEQGNAFLSKFPITFSQNIFYDELYKEQHEMTVEEFPFRPRALQHVALKMDKQSLHCFNTQGIWGLDGGDSERRLKMSNTIVDSIKNKENVLLAGDFNLRPHTQTIQNIEKYLKNVFQDELKTTFNIRRKTRDVAGYAESVVDMMFVSQNIKILHHECPGVDVSDHFPLVCSIEV